ncbi:MAG: PAS domain-containing protein, partial [Anaerolineae bacterium]|nr:PAS domain-containing protein [Anaerolineae bacterium]
MERKQRVNTGELQLHEERFQKLSESIQEAIVITDRGRVIDFNQQFSRLFGYELSEAVGMRGWEFVTAEYRDLISQNDLTTDKKNYEAMHRRKDRSVFWGLASSHSMEYQGRWVRVTVIRDIT